MQHVTVQYKGPVTPQLIVVVTSSSLSSPLSLFARTHAPAPRHAYLHANHGLSSFMARAASTYSYGTLGPLCTVHVPNIDGISTPYSSRLLPCSIAIPNTPRLRYVPKGMSGYISHVCRMHRVSIIKTHAISDKIPRPFGFLLCVPKNRQTTGKYLELLWGSQVPKFIWPQSKSDPVAVTVMRASHHQPQWHTCDDPCVAASNA